MFSTTMSSSGSSPTFLHFKRPAISSRFWTMTRRRKAVVPDRLATRGRIKV
jgi:hypothetical protein